VNFSLHHRVQNGSGAHAASYPMGTMGLFTWGVKRLDMLTLCNHTLRLFPSRHEGVLGEWRYSPTHSLTSALGGGEWSASRLGRFTPREKAPGTHWIGGWVGPRAVLGAVVKRKIPSLRRESNHTTPIVQPIAWSLY
jgi:hypothetical protein